MKVCTSDKGKLVLAQKISRECETLVSIKVMVKIIQKLRKQLVHCKRRWTVIKERNFSGMK